MKINSLILFFFLITSIISISYSQTYISGIPRSTENNYLLPQTFEIAKLTKTLGNSIFIEQVGDNNNLSVNTYSKSSRLNIVQEGNSNNVYIGVTANHIDERVLQIGNNNNFVDFANSSNIHNLELFQSGNNQNLIWYGGNSISEELIVKMKGENQSIIIRNFN